MELQRDLAETFLNEAVKASMELSPDNLSGLASLRVALQNFALLDGMPADLSQASMRLAKRIKHFEPGGADDVVVIAELLASVQTLKDSFQAFLDDPNAARPTQESGPAAAPVAAPEPEPAPVAAEPVEAAAEELLAEPIPEFMSGSDDPLMLDFLTEAEEHLEAAEEHLLTIEGQPEDMDALNAVFRSFHTIKGGAGILDLQPLCTFAHKAESVLDMARNHELELAGEAIDVCYSALDVLKGMVEGLRSGEQEIPLPEGYGEGLVALARIASGGGAPAPAPAAPLPSTPEPAAVDQPAVGAAPAPAQAAAPAAPEAATPAEVVIPSAAPKGAKRKDEDKPKATDKARKKPVGSVKVATDRLDNMINLVGELVIATAMVRQEVSELQDGSNVRSVTQLNKVTSELQHIAMSMRMVPLKATFQKAARMVRDVAQKCGKKARFASSGEDTELDRNVVEQLGDPLIHMLRNAVDHGIEPAEERLAAGKPEAGTVHLRAYHQGGSVVIELEDDGKGMNREAILRKAVGAGLYTEAQAQALPNEEVWPIIFHPGLSTTEKLSEVSGRGVGMDVVKKNIEALRGSVEIDSTPGKGSKLTIRLPLTLAIIDAMVVMVGERKYIIPTLQIQSFIRPEPEQVFTVQQKGEVVKVRDRVIPVHRLHHILGIESGVDQTHDGLLAITSGDGEDYALLVEDLKGQQQVVIKSMGSSEDHCPGIAGAAIIGDGTVGLILDTEGLARMAREQTNVLTPV